MIGAKVRFVRACGVLFGTGFKQLPAACSPFLSRSVDTAESFLRLDYLESRELVLSEKVNALKAEVR
jgi:hypothetical protein